MGIAGPSASWAEPITLACGLLEVAGGIFLLAGFWTPIAGALTAVDELWLAFSLPLPHPSDRWVRILLAVLSAGVAMLGPGAWSVDALLFGRKRFDQTRVR